jgi:hypothetical protein
MELCEGCGHEFPAIWGATARDGNGRLLWTLKWCGSCLIRLKETLDNEAALLS